ncbi:transmembrane protein 183 [Drosophila kikkawai]|uniref:Transmembrane protein 183 n=1 Tax=Drosophila kikkawai TaxID=30033 RepID=A0A6P4IB17_DROKI|nr:transmembrane protein 183 [Drosophila kikkawai]
MGLDADDCDDFIQNKLFRTRGKCAIYARQSDVFVEVKQKSALRVTAPTLPMAESNKNSNVTNVRHDIWFHIAMRIDPEDVQAFSLICKETARLVASRAFWRNLYRRHCTGVTSGWNLDLPAQLQLEQIRNCDTRALRSLVVEALFHCHRPLKVRLERGYHLDWLLERTFVSCWQKNYQCLWIMCYKFWNRLHNVQVRDESEESKVPVVNNWETLAEDDAGYQLAPAQGNANEGVVLLIVICPQYVPTPTQLSYDQQGARFRLQATRELLSTDMRANNLELDFAEHRSQGVAVTVKYPRIRKYKVLPWWHPDFQKFVK